MLKKLTKKFAYTYPPSKCVCKIPPKINTFYGLRIKDKNSHVECLIFSVKIYLFYIRHTICRFIVKRLCGYVAREHVHEDFLFQILTF
jgi:hypothetical protein